MLRWPDTATALQTSSPCPLSWVRLSSSSPWHPTIFPDLWVGLTALRVRFTPSIPAWRSTRAGSEAWELCAGSGISRGLGPAYHLLDPHSKQGPSYLLAGITNLWVLEGSWREMAPHSHPQGKQGS